MTALILIQRAPRSIGCVIFDIAVAPTPLHDEYSLTRLFRALTKLLVL